MSNSIEPGGRPFTLRAYAALLDSLPESERNVWLAWPVLLLSEGIRVDAVGGHNEAPTASDVFDRDATPFIGQADAARLLEPAPDDRRLLFPMARSKRSTRDDRLTLGRNDECDITLALPMVSKVHAYFYDVTPDSAEIEDANSRNGTFVGETKLEPSRRARLGNGSLIVVGHVVLEFRSAANLAAQLTTVGLRKRR